MGRGCGATSLGKRAKGLSPGELTCWGVLETSSPQDMHLGHLLGVATQGTPAGAGGLIQAQLPGRGQEEGQVIEGVRTAEGEGVEEVERARGAVFGLGPAHPGSTPCASCSSVSTQGKIKSLSTYCMPSPLLGCYRYVQFSQSPGRQVTIIMPILQAGSIGLTRGKDLPAQQESSAA